MKTFLIATILLLITVITGAQAQKQNLTVDTTQALKWYTQATSLHQQGKYSNALLLFEKAAMLYKKHKLWNRQINCRNKITRTLFLMAKYEDAMHNALLALQESQSKLKKDNTVEADAYNNIGNIYFEKGELDQAFEYTSKALEIRIKILGTAHPDVAVAYSDIGDIYFDKGDLDQALEFYQKSFQIKSKILGEEHPDVAESYSSIAFVYRDINDFENALKYYYKALQIWIKTLGEEHPDVGYAYHNLGIIYYFKGEYDKALEYNSKGLNIRMKILGEAHPDIAASYNNRGSISKAKGDFDKAVEYYQKALQIRRNALGEVHRTVAASYNNIGVAYYEKRDFDRAVEYYQKALQIWIKVLGEEHWDITFPYKNLANVYKDKGDFNKALEYNYKSLYIELKAPGQVHPSVASTYNDIGELYQAKGDYKKALQQFQQAILVNISSFQDTLVTHNPILSGKVSNNLYEFNLLNSLQLKGSVFEKLFMQGKTISDLELAYQTYCSADTLIQQIMFNYSSESDQVTFTGKSRQVYQGALQVCLELYQLTKQGTYLDKAFYFAERGKASVLAGGLADSKAKTFAGIADSLLVQDQHLRKQIADYTQQVSQQLSQSEAIDSSKLNEAQNLLFAAHRQQENLISQLEKDYPAYYHLKYAADSVSPAQLQQVLGKKTAVLEYVLTDSLLQIFILTQDAVTVQSLTLDSTFQRKVAAFREAILSQDEDLYHQVAYSLYSVLLPQTFSKSIRQLIIIPEGELTTLPFEALLTQDKKIKKGKTASYLLNKYAISYAYSARLLYERLNQPQKRAGKQLLALAPVFADSLSNAIVAINRDVLMHHQPGLPGKTPAANALTTTDTPSADDSKSVNAESLRGWLLDGQYVSPLLASEREVTSIARLFSKQGNSAKVLLHTQAGEEQLKSVDMSKYSYLHLATHGFVNESYPELSGLLLAQNSSSKEDGILYTGEIYNLRLKAELVTLSACETGLGKLAHGEGVIGLTRALLYAGAENIVVSFWKVSDESTADLMEDFYEALLSGSEKAQALQTAKRKMVGKGKYSHPFYWAPFVLVGK